MMKLVTKTGTILHVDQPIWLPHPNILQLLDTKLVPNSFEEPEGAPIFLMLGDMGSSENLGQCFKFLEQEFGLPKTDNKEWHLTRSIEVGDNEFVIMRWTRDITLPASHGFMADQIVRLNGDLVKNRVRSANPKIVGDYLVNLDVISKKLNPEAMVTMPKLPFIHVPNENKTITKVMGAVSKFDLDATDVPALISIAPSVDW